MGSDAGTDARPAFHGGSGRRRRVAQRGRARGGMLAWARPAVAGVMGAAINAGILMLSQLAQLRSLTADSWRWLFTIAAVPAALGLLVWFFLPESPAWLATRGRKTGDRRTTPVRLLFRPPLLRITLIGIMLGSIPLVGAWAASKWMIPWADQIAGVTQPDYKAMTQGMVGFWRDAGQFRRWPDRQSARPPAIVFPHQSRIDGVDDRDVPAHGAAAGHRSCGSSWRRALSRRSSSAGCRCICRSSSPRTFERREAEFPTMSADSRRRGVLAAGALFTAFGGSYPAVGSAAALIAACRMLRDRVGPGYDPHVTGFRRSDDPETRATP